MEEHGRAIALSVITTALAVLVTAAMTGSLDRAVDWFRERFDDDLPAEAVATWEFVGYGSEPPAGEMVLRIDRLTFHDEDSYSAVGTMLFPGSGSMPVSGSGTFEMDDGDTVRFTNSAEGSSFAIMDIEVNGNELQLTDHSAGVTSVFRRVGD